MGFISYNMKFFKERLNLYESKYFFKAPEEIVHEAKVLLKFLEDAKDEGYNDTYEYINKRTDAVNRLQNFILKNGDVPFNFKKLSPEGTLHYKNEEIELNRYLSILKNQLDSGNLVSEDVPTIFYDILKYTKKIFKSANPNTAYCFLLRDTLLPYLAFERWNKSNNLKVKPLFISRKYLSFFDDNNGERLYGEIQNIIFDALDNNVENFEQLKEYVKGVLKSKKEFTELIYALNKILESIKQENILIIESGYIGTIPVLLSALDSRVDFIMFTTLPYFYEIYKGKFFTCEFEKIRLFETIQCQDSLFKMSSIDGEGINICETSNKLIKKNAFAELKIWGNLISE